MLKEAREAKGLSLDDLQDVTKIQKRYLVGIEEGKYEMMPGKFYVRAFIKQYCEAVGLDPEAVFEQYKGDVPAVYTEELPDQLSRVQSRKSISSGSSKFFTALPKVLTAVVIIAALVLVYIFVSNMMDKKQGDQTGDKPAPEEVKRNESEDFASKKGENTPAVDEDVTDEETTPEEAEENIQELVVAGTNGKNTTYELKNTKEFNVKLVSTGEDSWVGVMNGSNNYIYQGTLTQDSPQELDLKDEEVVSFNLGKANYVEIYVNDEKLEYAISPTERTVQLITIQFLKDEEESS